MPRPTDERPSVLAGSPARFALTLLVALVATGPGFRSAVIDGASLPGAVGQFLGAFALLWLLGGIAVVVWHHGAVAADPAGAADLGDVVPEMVPGATAGDR